MSNCHHRCHSKVSRPLCVGNNGRLAWLSTGLFIPERKIVSDERIAELVTLYPAFQAAVEEASPGAMDAILRDDLRSELAAKRDVYLPRTAELLQKGSAASLQEVYDLAVQWYELGLEIRRTEEPLTDAIQ
jgi:hypothetical protein